MDSPTGFTLFPGGDEIFFTIQQRNLVSVVMNSTKRNGKWSETAVASFSGIYNDLEASFTFDVSEYFFSSNSLSIQTTQQMIYTYGIPKEKWRMAGPSPLEQSQFEKDEFYLQWQRMRSVVYHSDETGKVKEDIVMCELKNGHYLSPLVFRKQSIKRI